MQQGRLAGARLVCLPQQSLRPLGPQLLAPPLVRHRDPMLVKKKRLPVGTPLEKMKRPSVKPNPPGHKYPGVDVSWWPQARYKRTIRKAIHDMPKDDNNDPAYRITSAVLFERYPTLNPEVPDWQTTYLEMRDKLDQKRHRRIPEWFLKQMDKDEDPLVLEDEKNAQKWYETQCIMPSKVTACDIMGNVRTLDRRLQNTVYLLLKKDRKEHAWQFPQIAYDKNIVIPLKRGKKTGEGTRETGRRALTHWCGEDMRAYMVGNAPIAYLKYDFPKGYSETHKGSKTFFHHAFYVNGEVILHPDVVDFAWVTKTEMEKYLSPELWNIAKQMIWDEPWETEWEKYLAGKAPNQVDLELIRDGKDPLAAKEYTKDTDDQHIIANLRGARAPHGTN